MFLNTSLQIIILLFHSCVFPTAQKPSRGEIIERWEASNQVFKVRVTEYGEQGAYLNGAYYAFESAKLDSQEWQEFMVFRHDDRPKLPRDQVRFLDDAIAYAFMGWMYAVTIDGGSTWSVWNAQKDLPNWQCCNHGLIQNVDIKPDGNGVMTLNPVPGRSGEVPALHTKDFGRHWDSN